MPGHVVDRCGAIGLDDGSVRWRVWAPNAKAVDLALIDGDRRRVLAMTAEEHGYFHHTEPDVAHGQRYVYRLDGGSDRPDPCSRWQPDGVHRPSAVVRPERFAWTDAGWRGVPRDELVIYELHVGTFTPDGTFDAVIPRLDSLKQLGVTAIELLPVAEFPGPRNWGYDGVHPFAPQSSYGGPDGLRRLADACHRVGLGLIVDVVYNHLGPEGNYLNEFGPYFTDHYRTGWGRAVNYDGAGSDAVRAFALDNVRMWVDEYRVDGLRLDAVHAIYDSGPRHILRDIQETAAAAAGRPVHVIAESDLNDPRLLLPPDRGGIGLDAQWSDDFHHAVHTVLTGEHQGYYADFGRRRQLARAFETPFVYAGDYSGHRGRSHGAPAGDLPGDRFVVAVQNHDQVGNRARGDRFGTLLPEPAQRLAACLLLLAPHLPLLFMGEEYGERNPFPFFCSFEDAGLAEAVKNGRRAEFAAFAWQGEVPDPQAEATFAAARLSWAWPAGTHHAGLRHLYADLVAARRAWPALRDFERRSARLLPDADDGPVLHLVRGDRDRVEALFNLTGEPQPMPLPSAGALLFTSEAPRYCGEGSGVPDGKLRPYECAVFGPTS